mmetsp:Transcript_30872/g.61813  ORF Transcript_30872/g.61813 Transcript_30872/m.61813 type:complete len:200 (+) Transcript_30872:254-853(+)
MVSNSEGSGENTEHEKRLRFSLVRHIVLDGVLEKVELEEHLRQDEGQEDGGVLQLSDREQVSRDAELGHVDGGDADILRLVHPEGHGDGLHAQGFVSLDGLEVVDDGDAQTRKRIEHREDDLLRGDASSVEHFVAAPPRQRNVRGAKGVGALPADGFELQRRGTVHVGDQRAEHAGERDHGPVVDGPLVEPESQRPAPE